MLAAQVQPDRRQSERDEVFYRTRATAAGRGSFAVQVVNISANGFMIRADIDVAIGDSIMIRLPVVGEIRAEVRWSLGGRVGCQFVRMIGLAPYLELLAALLKETR
ncbi:PilZ domain-containing protein [Sphingomonas tabacisoli]|uniref:PilZ domain-containing protein n=1 Tax=Sphingomonas tabacisoli TaxID=2249466 RepID=A0ABW4I2H5_9SPHN